MDSPANRVQRILVGMILSFSLMTALAISEGLIRIFGCDGSECLEENSYAFIFPIILLLSITLYYYSIFLRGKSMKREF